jgi:nicotinate dehydrogenase subunit B
LKTTRKGSFQTLILMKWIATWIGDKPRLGSYPILTFPAIPEIAYDLIDRPAEPPWGAGEPTAAVVPSVISNAVFDATGLRLRSIPYTPDKVKAALRAA